MGDSPSRPPGAEARDAGAPRDVVIATRLLWIAIVAGIPISLREFQGAASADNRDFLLAFTLAIYALSVCMVVYLGRGRHWARVVLLVFNVLNLLSFLLAFGEMRKYPTGDFILLFLVAALDLAALYLVHTRTASPWFRPVTPRR